MQLVKFRTADDSPRVGWLEGHRIRPLNATLAELLDSADPSAAVEAAAARAETPIATTSVRLCPPIDHQEVWAAGVTYRRSQAARMEESDAAASCYDHVYGADRPELFFKSSWHRVVGPDEPVRIRSDATWSVPEPELALVLNARLDIVGFTIGNDMSSRDIEGANPLYLPQAKIYDGACALGPAITLAGDMPPPAEIGIAVTVERDRKKVFAGSTSAGEMKRSFVELRDWLGRDQTFPHGAFLLTGTGIVPDSDFTLEPGDVVEISIDGIGTLRNPVERSSSCIRS